MSTFGPEAGCESRRGQGLGRLLTRCLQRSAHQAELEVRAKCLIAENAARLGRTLSCSDGSF